MNRQDVKNLYKQHLDNHFSEDESRAIMLWVNDYLSVCTESDFQQINTSNHQLDDLENFNVFIPLKRLLNSEPVQYVFQTAFFHKYQFKVDSNTLIPRPETEELLELILKANNPLLESTFWGLDIGTGSGCIPITLLKERPNWKFKAIDICEGALKIARSNSLNLKVDDRIQLEKINILESDLDFSSFDLIISNPPYIPYSELNKLNSNVTKFEPHIALFTESDPLIFYKRIANLALKSARSGTQIWLETHQDYCSQTAELFDSLGTTKKIEDLSGNPRFINCIIN
jgi:release factor glutamine methyltransferase